MSNIYVEQNFNQFPSIIINDKLYKFQVENLSLGNRICSIFFRKIDNNNLLDIDILDNINTNSHLYFKTITINNKTIFNQKIKLRLYDKNYSNLCVLYIKPYIVNNQLDSIIIQHEKIKNKFTNLENFLSICNKKNYETFVNNDKKIISTCF